MTFIPTRLTRVRRSTRLAGVVVAAGVVAGALGVTGAQGATHSTLRMTTLVTKAYGTVLESTRTVYTLTPSKVACTATCLHYWPQVLLPKGAAKAVAGPGVSAAKLGTVKRAGGRLQVTYAGKALYWFSLDKSPGQVKGNVSDTWGRWSVVVLVKPKGTTTTTTVATTTTTSGGGGGGIGF